MLLASVCRAGATPALISTLRAPVVPKQLVPRIQVSRLFGNSGRGTYRRSRAEANAFQRFFVPEGATEFTVVKRVLGVASLAGLGALTLYGLSLQPKVGVPDYHGFWPDYVKERIRTTYLYFGTAIATSVASTAMCLRSPQIMSIVTRQGWLAFIATSAALVGSGILVHSLPYKEGFGPKQMAFLGHAALIGAVFAPLYVLCGHVAIRAAWYTAGALGGFTVVALSAPHKDFILSKAHLGAGLGVLFATTIGSMFLPPTSPIQFGLQSVIIYGGLLLFTLFFVYDSQKLAKEAWQIPKYGGLRQFDPINHAMGLFIDAVNIFMRIQMILSGQGPSKRK